MLSHPHDSAIHLEQTDINQILETAKRVVEENDLPTVMRYIESLNRMEQSSWFARAHILYLLSQRWDSEKLGSFYEWSSIQTSRAPETIRRMVKIWEFVIAKPDHSKKRLEMILTKPPSGLYYLAAAAAEGQLTEANWKDAETANNKYELREIMLEVRGEQRRGKAARKLMMEPDGTLRTRKGNGPYKTYGRLNVEIDDPDIAEAIARTIGGGGIFRRE